MYKREYVFLDLDINLIEYYQALILSSTHNFI